MRMDEFFRRISTMKKIPKSRIVMQVPPSKEFRWENGEIEMVLVYSVTYANLTSEF